MIWHLRALQFLPDWFHTLGLWWQHRKKSFNFCEGCAAGYSDSPLFNEPLSEGIWRAFFQRENIQTLHQALWRYIFMSCTLAILFFINQLITENKVSAAYNSSQSRKHMTVLLVWTWHRRVNNASQRTSWDFIVFLLGIWSAGFENVGICCFSTAIWLVFIVWVASVSVNAL